MYKSRAQKGRDLKDPLGSGKGVCWGQQPSALDLRSFSCAFAVLGYPRLAVVGNWALRVPHCLAIVDCGFRLAFSHLGFVVITG